MTHPSPTPRNAPAPRPDIIPIRLTPPSVPVRKRARSVPVEQRPWRVLLVPPTPGAQTRAFDVARWQARLVVIALSALMLVAAGSVTALLEAVDGPDVVATGAELAAMRGRLTVVEDSLTQLRATLTDGQDESSDVTPAAPLAVARVKTVSKPRALLARLRDIVATDGDEVGASPAGAGISADGLPVVGLISSTFSTGRRHPVLHIIRPHRGIDVSAARGTHITAPAAGKVISAGRRFALGLLVEIEHPNGVITRYAHCRTALVKVGQTVARGTLIGTVGSSGLTTGPHLHYEILVNGEQVDPIGFKFGAATPDSANASGVAPLP
ncbi:MAG: putative Peptidase [Gemmatimonadetes bacterium]|nr:putative Peptidase [Gemmatimonadota bacterium]